MLAVLTALLLAAPQTEADAYTVYELLDPATHSFRIGYDVSATTPGATAYFNPIRPGSAASDERVFDRATGKPLRFAEVEAPVARAEGLPGAADGTRYIRVELARPVPAGGAARVRIDKTYADPKSYFTAPEGVVFERSLGIRRNAVVLPPAHELVAVNVPAQVLRQADGRLRVSFINTMPGPAQLRLVARPSGSGETAPAAFDERAAQTRNIVYYLNDPATHSFALTHDYTEARPGTARYVNVVRPGSTVSAPSGRDLDSGAPLAARIVRGADLLAVAPDAGAAAEAVVFDFAPVAEGATRRVRIAETYTDPAGYRRDGDALVWRRKLGRSLNAVVLPAGWQLTGCSVPATVSTGNDGRVRIDLVNAAPGDLDVTITALRR